MWKKEEGTYPASTTRLEPAAAARGERVPMPERAASPQPGRDRATIGRSITIRGEVSGNEDLLIEGRVDGSVDLKQHSVTVGPEGEVKANIVGRVVTIEGSVEGNLNAEEQVILRSSAQVTGDIAAPRVVLEDGARFRGGVDMGGGVDRASRTASGSRTATTTRPESAGSAAALETARAESGGAKDKDEAKSSSSPGDGAARGAAPSAR